MARGETFVISHPEPQPPQAFDSRLPSRLCLIFKSDPCGRLTLRRRQRRLRWWWRHEQQTLAAVLATVTHHSYTTVDTANAALRGQKIGTSIGVSSRRTVAGPQLGRGRLPCGSRGRRGGCAGRWMSSISSSRSCLLLPSRPSKCPRLLSKTVSCGAPLLAEFNSAAFCRAER